MNTLVIDTSDKIARLGLFRDDKLIDKLEWEAHRELSKTFYLELDKLLGRNKLQYKDLSSIIVVCGPGSFTGLRMGIVIVNAFSYALGIKTAGVIQKEKMTLEEMYSIGKEDLKKGQIIEPFYGREPNITIKKK
ncbi:tRNA (adenosine(37)-N6)-threonylcarbamoyltransferase complex dimerization subunit type 1 TsaB [candidate division WS5 bacterium]|uniref:tRNA (Adenosine(37)-N6)-threonylcarbamoyltransferase complex dimerization subunit type 1 TsaB n=1 Tax=candidate division WS5 bacterium TaxID=2093353 RepID=A0A419DFX2_9BACT|nr:MAG: tRNA (adenosine(37)-N6)-threonylcarbamoyltransferase complex dimerization subunit type 1 TsaB [candidate division WS5 bacterium]